MSYEEYVNEEAVALTEEVVEPAEAVEEVVASEETVAEEIAAEEAVAEAEPCAEEDVVLQYSVEEPLTVPTMDEDLFEASVDEEFDFEIAEDEQQVGVCDSFQAKCDEVRLACKDVIQRISNDLEQTNYNPYIRSTTTYRYEILKKSTDTEPIDVFEFQRTSGFSLRAMAITTALVAAADVAVGKFLKKKLK